jgi:hypothetical protein
MHAPFSSALPSAVKLGTVISQRIRYIAICSTEKVFNTVWGPYHAYFLNIGYSVGMLGNTPSQHSMCEHLPLPARPRSRAQKRP